MKAETLTSYMEDHGVIAVVMNDRICAWAQYSYCGETIWRAEWVDATWRDVRAFLGY